MRTRVRGWKEGQREERENRGRRRGRRIGEGETDLLEPEPQPDERMATSSLRALMLGTTENRTRKTHGSFSNLPKTELPY